MADAAEAEPPADPRRRWTAFAFLLLPIYWLVVTSFKPIESLFVVPPQLWPREFTFENYINQFDTRLIQLFRNSLIVSGAAAVLSTFAGSLCAYAISRYYFRFKSGLLLLYVLSLTINIFSQIINRTLITRVFYCQ